MSDAYVPSRAGRGVRKRVHCDTERAVSARGQLLIVDGHADGAESLQLLLEALGYMAHVALDGATAVAIASRQAIALALVSIDLPDGDGYVLAAQLRALSPATTLIALTGYGHAADRRRALDAGFDDHVLKPASVEHLESVLQRHVGPAER